MSDLISMDKQYKTRNGRAVEVLKTGVNHITYPVVVVITEGDGSQYSTSRTSTGRVVHNGGVNEGDLIEVKPRVKQDVWLNVYQEKRPRAHFSKKDADSYSNDDRIACVKVEIDCEHGEGL